jgi:hypothetical protein
MKNIRLARALALAVDTFETFFIAASLSSW